MIEIPVPAESVAPKSCKPHVIGALIAAILAGEFPDPPRWQKICPCCGHIEFSPFGIDLGPRANSFWIAVQRVGAVLSGLDEASGEPTVHDVVAAITEDFHFEQDLHFIYPHLAALAIASLRWDDEFVESVLDTLEPSLAGIADEQDTYQVMRVIFLTLRGVLLGRDLWEELSRQGEKIGNEDIASALSSFLMNDEDPKVFVESSAFRDFTAILEILRSSNSFQEIHDAMTEADGWATNWYGGEKVLLAALAGAHFGIHRMPPALTTKVRIDEKLVSSWRVNSDRDGFYNLDQLQDVALTLAGFKAIRDTEPESTNRKAEVEPGLFAGNLGGATQIDEETVVISLCRTGWRFDSYSIHRQYYLIDKEGDINPDLRAVVQDAVDEIDKHLSEGRKVLVHCHGGRSRTALILKAWKMRRDGVDEEAAHLWLKANWPDINRKNSTFVDFLKNEWPHIVKELNRG